MLAPLALSATTPLVAGWRSGVIGAATLRYRYVAVRDGHNPDIVAHSGRISVARAPILSQVHSILDA